MNQPIGNTNINQAAFFDFSISSVLKNGGSTRHYNGPIVLSLLLCRGLNIRIEF